MVCDCSSAAGSDVKNHWNTKLKKKLSGMGIDPVTHKPHNGDRQTPAPQAPSLAKAALGCFKDEMLHLLTKRRNDIQLQQFGASTNTYIKHEDNKDETIERIKYGLSKAIKEPDMSPVDRPWDPVRATSACLGGAEFGFQYEIAIEAGYVSPWSQSMCTGSTCTAEDQQGRFHERAEDGHGENSGSGIETRNGSSIFNSDCSLWDLPSDDLTNSIV